MLIVCPGCYQPDHDQKTQDCHHSRAAHRERMQACSLSNVLCQAGRPKVKTAMLPHDLSSFKEALSYGPALTSATTRRVALGTNLTSAMPRQQILFERSMRKISFGFHSGSAISNSGAAWQRRLTKTLSAMRKLTRTRHSYITIGLQVHSIDTNEPPVGDKHWLDKPTGKSLECDSFFLLTF